MNELQNQAMMPSSIEDNTRYSISSEINIPAVQNVQKLIMINHNDT